MENKNFSLRCIAYQEKDQTYTGVCLDLDIVEEGHPTLNEAVLSVNEAIVSHVLEAKRLGFPKELIERPAPKEYWDRVKDSIGAPYPPQQSEPLHYYTTSSRSLQHA